MAQMALLERPSCDDIVLVRVPYAQIDRKANPRTAAIFDAFILLSTNSVAKIVNAFLFSFCDKGDFVAK